MTYFRFDPFTIKGQYFNTRTYNQNAEARYYSARQRRDMARDRYDDYQESRSGRYNDYDNGYDRHSHHSQSQHSYYNNSSSMSGGYERSQRDLEQELRVLDRKIDAEERQLERLEGRHGLFQRHHKQDKLNSALERDERRRDQILNELGYSNEQSQSTYNSGYTRGNNNYDRGNYGPARQDHGHGSQEGGMDTRRAGQQFVLSIAAAMETKDPGERTRLVDAAIGYAEACRDSDGRIKFPQGMTFTVRGPLKYGFNDDFARNFATVEDAIRFTTNDLSKTFGTRITDGEITTAMNLGPRYDPNRAAGTPGASQSVRPAREIVDSPERGAFFDAIMPQMYPGFKGTDEEFIRKVEHEYKATNPEVVEDGKFDSRELMLVAKKLDAINAMLPANVKNTLDDLLRAEKIERRNGTYVDTKEPSTTLVNRTAPAGADAATTARIIPDSAKKTAFLQLIAKYGNMTGSEAEIIQRIENTNKATYPKEITRDGKLDANELILAASQLEDVGAALPADLKKARDELLEQEKIVKVNGAYVDQATGTGAAADRTGPAASADNAIDAASGPAAKLYKGAVGIGHLSQNQVESLQTLLVDGGKDLHTAKSEDGIDGKYGPVTEKALKEVAGVAGIDLAKLDFRDAKNAEVLKLTKYLNDQATLLDQEYAKQQKGTVPDTPAKAPVVRDIGYSQARHAFLTEMAKVVSVDLTKATTQAEIEAQDKKIIHAYEQFVRDNGLIPDVTKKDLNLTDDKFDTRELAVTATILKNSGIAAVLQSKGVDVTKLDALLQEEKITQTNGVYHDGKSGGAEITMPTGIGAPQNSTGAKGH